VEHGIQTRFRIDGVLQELDLGDLDEMLNQNRGKLLSRLKILSKLDIAAAAPAPGRKLPRAPGARDGQTATVDFRISIIPGYYGRERGHPDPRPRGLPQSVEGLGLRAPVALRMRQLLRSSTGIILVTGPTGSGKSTSLFGALKSVYQPGIQDPHGREPDRVRLRRSSGSTRSTSGSGNTFATFLRSFLRHDPDVIMIGEIRDGETRISRSGRPRRATSCSVPFTPTTRSARCPGSSTSESTPT